MEGSAPSKMEERHTSITSTVNVRRARDVGAPDTLDSFAPTVGAKRDRKRLMFVHLD
jgi:hypothetical protein